MGLRVLQVSLEPLDLTAVVSGEIPAIRERQLPTPIVEPAGVVDRRAGSVLPVLLLREAGPAAVAAGARSPVATRRRMDQRAGRATTYSAAQREPRRAPHRGRAAAPASGIQGAVAAAVHPTRLRLARVGTAVFLAAEAVGRDAR
jgi:hypothetical protein